MPELSETPVADAYQGNWVDRYAPFWSRPYLRLSRADRPIGTWLLLLPCWWGLMLAVAMDGPQYFDIWIFLGCTIGAAAMRGAGCTWNDVADRHIDARVQRTSSRPIPAGQVTVRQALVWMTLQAFVGLLILLTFNGPTILLGVVSVLLIAIYPFAKRFTWWPQIFLGLAFNWGVLLAWTAHRGQVELPAVLLYLSGIAWTVFYDTIYAHQDTEDDALIGVKSTARLFGANTHRILRWFMVAAVLLMMTGVLVAILPTGNAMTLVIALGGPWAFGWHLAWQNRSLDIDDPSKCLKLFRSNRDAGLIPVLFFAIAMIV